MACVKWISADHQLRNRIHKEFGDNWQSQYLHLINGGDNLEPAEIQMMNLLRSSFALKLHFSIENLFVNLIKTKNPNYSDVGFYKIFTKILNYCGIPDHGIERKTACALANIRNSFHTNGIHTQPNMSIELKNKEFKFCEGEALMCASWEHLIIVASVNIELLETILLNPAFNLTKEIIPDKFSSLDL
jgi:hypothetical protein